MAIEQIKRRLGRNPDDPKSFFEQVKYELWPTTEAIQAKVAELVALHNSDSLIDTVQNLGSGTGLLSRAGSVLSGLGLAVTGGLTLSATSDTVTFGVGSDVRRQWSHHVYRSTTASLRYIPYGNTAEQPSITYLTEWFFGQPGSLRKVYIQSSLAAGSTAIALWKGGSNVASKTVTMGSASTVYEFDFTTETSSYAAKDLLAVSVNPTNVPNDIQVSCEWEFDAL